MPTSHLTTSDFSKQIVLLQEQMMLAAENLDFEQAIAIREQIKEIKDKIDKKQKKKDWQDSKEEDERLKEKRAKKQ
jgi:excinuclease UvrABC helicase subunit UvrB